MANAHLHKLEQHGITREKYMRQSTCHCLMILSLLLVTAVNAQDIQTRLTSAVDADHRDSANVARDVYRHPVETLEFLGLRPDMTVVEIWPSGGWYAEILAPVLRTNGVYFAAGYAMTADRTPGWRKEVHKEFMEKLEQRPAVYDHVVATELSVPERTTVAPPGSADMVLTFRNVHNWMKGDYEQTMFQVFHRTLKPGGILGVVEHRAKPGTSIVAMKESGYVTEAYVAGLAEKAGFVLEARSDINANPKDTTAHPAGVWSLPPSFRYCGRMDESAKRDQCLGQYREIGESDRMTLRFRKPR